MLINNPVPISKMPTQPEVKKLLEDLQGNILKAHAKPHVRLLFLKFTGDIEQVKSWVKTLPVTSMEEQLKDHAAFKMERLTANSIHFCSLSLTKKGYEFLDTSSDALNDSSFKDGMQSGTIKADPPKNQWEEKYQKTIHALITLAHSELIPLNQFALSIEASLIGIATVIASEQGTAISGEKEHFGFADGRSQPRYFEDDVADDGPSLNWQSFASLNLALVKDPNGKAFNSGITGDGDFPVDDFSGTHSYGSYLAFRKLEQDVAGWNSAVVQLATDLNQSPDLVGAYAVGRFKDGTPVTLHDTEQNKKPIENDFDYATDMAGSKCPFHAHIRKANPRGDTHRKFQVPLEAEKAHRITRRGIPYENGDKKGLLFMCYQSSITKQFDFIQNDWVDDEDFLNTNTGIDDVIGQGASNPKTWPGSHGGTPAAQKFSFGKFVTMKGGEYFFTPSISFLKAIK